MSLWKFSRLRSNRVNLEECVECIDEARIGDMVYIQSEE